MHRKTWWIGLLSVMLLVAPLTGAFAAPPSVVLTDTQAPDTTVVDDEIVLIESNGRLRVDDPHQEPNVEPVEWNSGVDTGYSRVAVGDFNGDGDAEIVAMGGSRLKIYDPVVQPGKTAVSYQTLLSGGRQFRLITVGDFDKDGRDEVAVTHTEIGGFVSGVKVYDGGANGTSWTVIYQASFIDLWQDIAAGDINNDGYDDLAMVRKKDNLLKIVSGRDWTPLVNKSYGYPWLALALGNVSSVYGGDEVALTREKVLAILNSALVFRWDGSKLVDLLSNANYLFFPYFTSLAMGDVNGDGDQELLLLRDPTANVVSLLMLNPAGSTFRKFEQAIGYLTSAWKLVRSGDVDADGRDEIVVLRGDRYRIYKDPQSNDTYTDVVGSYLTTSTTSNIPTMAIGNFDGTGQTLGPVLSVSPTSLAFDVEYGASSGIKAVSIQNGGTSSSIAWQAQILEGANWLKLDKTSGGTPGTLGVSVDTEAVLPGSYTGKIRIAATTGGVTGSPKDIDVSLNLRGVALSVSPQTLSFQVEYGQTSPVKQLVISSAGGGSNFGWTAEILEGATWLNLSSTSGTTPSTVNVTVDSAAAGPGSHVGTIRVTASDPLVSGSPQYVTVNLEVPDPGFLVTPTTLRFHQKQANPSAAQSVQIIRSGIPTKWVATAVPTDAAAQVAAALASGEATIAALDGSLDGVDVAPPAWLDFSPDQGTTDATMLVSVDLPAPGKYAAVILVVATDPDTSNRIYVVDVNAMRLDSFSYLPSLLAQ